MRGIGGKMKYNQEDFLKDLQESFDMCLNIARKKNTDYANKEHDPFRNFRMVEHLGLCSTKTGIIVRLSDKLARICNLLDTTSSYSRFNKFLISVN